MQVTLKIRRQRNKVLTTYKILNLGRHSISSSSIAHINKKKMNSENWKDKKNMYSQQMQKELIEAYQLIHTHPLTQTHSHMESNTFIHKCRATR